MQTVLADCVPTWQQTD